MTEASNLESTTPEERLAHHHTTCPARDKSGACTCGGLREPLWVPRPTPFKTPREKP